MLLAQYRGALQEVARLSIADDHGSGERTARLAGLAAWQAEAERLRGLIEAAGGHVAGGPVAG
ncbi:MAG: hypothetical protein Q8M79_07810 [Dehalococcoidia bacterium]|nr:hypothetical protein [Dehalococcoidia bacterium]